MALGRPAEGHEHRSSGVNSPRKQTLLSGLVPAFHAAILAAFLGTVLSLTKPATPAAHDRDPDSDQNPDSTDKPLP